MTLVMAAAQKMMPKSRKPRSPAAERKACAAGLAALARRIDDDAAGDDAENGEEQHIAHDAGDGDAGQRRAVDGRQVFDADHAPVQQPVRAGIGDVTADGAADDGGDSREIDRVRQEGLAEGVTHRRCGNEGHIKR